jgi:hypothetical protein
VFGFGTKADAVSSIRLSTGATEIMLYGFSGGGGIGSYTADPFEIFSSNITRASWASGEFYLSILGLAARIVSQGAIDSGGAGYRLLRITN